LALSRAYSHIEALRFKILKADFKQVSRHKRKTNKEMFVLRSNNHQLPPIGAPWVILRFKDHSVTNSEVPEISGFTGYCWNAADPRKTRAPVLKFLLLHSIQKGNSGNVHKQQNINYR
jgi:hypothetical protein